MPNGAAFAAETAARIAAQHTTAMPGTISNAK
jgi:hypothetical protein